MSDHQLDVMPIVGVGASAGGIEALEGFFRGLPSKPGMAFVVITHLSPNRESMLQEIIGRYTDMRVFVAEDGAVAERDTVHILPPDTVLGIKDSRLQVRRLNSVRERKPVDIFFSELAKDRGEHAVGVVLSGGDSDGTLGVKAIKERGGLTLAQVADGHGPSHPSMPDSAISTGFVDFAVPVESMGAKLVEFARSASLTDGVAVVGQKVDGNRSWAQTRQEIYSILRSQIGHDFGGYKPSTFTRRVQRRMHVNDLNTTKAYVERLRQDPKEVNALFRDLLINVTNFFRDADAFASLSALVIPRLFEKHGADDTVRVWVPGCATGEEVFSVAILLREHMDTLSGAVPRVQIFATDIDELALAVARAARYPHALLDSVSPERRERFFTADGASYQLVKEVRDLCVFSPHSVIRDPPFSRLDLISCRNLLIYFGADIQNQVIPIFHYALRPGGYLFLGTSENVSQFPALFTPVEKKHRLFRSSNDAAGARVSLFARAFTPASALHSARAAQPPSAGVAVRQAVDNQVLDRHAPPHVVVNEDGEVIYYSVRTGKYLEAPAGAPSRQLLAMARKGLRVELRSIFREAVDGGRPAIRKGVSVEMDDGRVQLLTLTVEPVADRPEGESLFLILFSDDGLLVTREEAYGRAVIQADEAALHLEGELRDTRERLQGMIEEYETAVEELKSSNEELVSVNEELQSTNEELEASKEELQSLNEELHTVNAELTQKVDDLDRANNDLQNLFESTQVATVFLDRNLIIRSFTPVVSKVFNIRPGDLGRPLMDLSSRLPLPDLAEDLRAVIGDGAPIERRIETEEGAANYLVRLISYRNSDEKIDGVVLTFIDVTSLTRAEAHQRLLIAELNHRVKNMLAIAVAVIAQASIGGKSPDEFKKAAVERLRAMARSYSALSQENWVDVPLVELIEAELEPFGTDRLTLDGPPIRLKPRIALSIGMVLHELATNAGKHGALSVADGNVAVFWSAENDTLGLHWRETGGPPVTPPERHGFGLKLVTREMSYNLSGQAQLNFAGTGLSVDLRCPLDVDPRR